MDWRNSAWVGIASAGLLVIFIVLIIWFAGGSGTTAVEGSPTGLQFECDACQGHFKVKMTELEDYSVYSKYMQEYTTASECRLCGEMEAYAAYFCPECDKWYRYTRAQGSAQHTYCPEGHPIPEEHQ